MRDAPSRLWLALTAEGHRAYRGHVRALQEIVDAAGGWPAGLLQAAPGRRPRAG
ncbi:hypothetical protein [Blastococcus sp. SYSU DS0533]